MIQDPHVVAAIEAARQSDRLPPVAEQISSLRLAQELVYEAMRVLGWYWLEDGEHIWAILRPLEQSHEAIIHLCRALDPEGSWASFETSLTFLASDTKEIRDRAFAHWPALLILQERQ